MADEALDEFEKRILRALQRDGRLSTQELAEEVGLSASPCWRRVKALEQRGYIRRYAALLDEVKLGVGQTVFAHVTLVKHDREGMADFERMAAARPEVMECYSMTGQADYILKVAVADVQAYERFLQEAVFRLPAVSHVHSNFALRPVKYEVAYPVA